MKLRSALKTRAAEALWRTGMDKAVGRFTGGSGPVVIGYHRVVESFRDSAETSIPSMLVSLRSLERHLDWIGQRYRFVDLDELGRLLESGSGAADRVAAVTFDDGYRDFYDLAFPLLKRKGIPAAVFAVTGLVNTYEAPVHDRLYLMLARRNGRGYKRSCAGIRVPDLSAMSPYQATRAIIEKLPLPAMRLFVEELESEDPVPRSVYESFRSLDWNQLAAIQRAGFIVGSHTRSHVLLTMESRDRLRDELVDSRLHLEDKLGTPIRHFAYPSGIYDERAVEAVAGAGYEYAYTTCTHRSARHPLLTIPRTVLWENSCLDAKHAFSPALLSCQIHRVFGLLAGCRQLHTADREVAG